jgi:hypothetical protein
LAALFFPRVYVLGATGVQAISGNFNNEKGGAMRHLWDSRAAAELAAGG